MASTFRLDAMDCPSEEQLVRLRLQGVDGVEDLQFDLDARTVDVHHRLDAKDVLHALDELDLGVTHVGDRVDHLVTQDSGRQEHQRRALAIALGLNASLFVIEVVVGLVASSAGVLADGLDMGADAAVYGLSLVAVGMADRTRRRLTATSGWFQMGLAVLGFTGVVWRLFTGDAMPDPTSMVAVSLLALAANVATLAVLRGVRDGGIHLRASWIFTTNDVLVNLLVIAAAGAVAWSGVAVPDLLVGGAIFLVVANGAVRILRLSRQAA